MKVNALFVCALALSLSGLQGCKGGNSSSQDAGPTSCTTFVDCGQAGGPWQCTGGSCVKVITCSNASQCTSGQVCEDAVCVNPGCATAAECGSGQLCQAGKCTSSSAIATCAISPKNAVVHQGQTVSLAVVAQDASGNTVPSGAVTWSASTPLSVADATKGSIGATAGGAGTVTAKIGGVTCATASVTAFAPVASATLRAVVIDARSKLPIANATVMLDANAAGKQKTGADGVATFAVSGTGAHDVHVFAQDHNYLSFIQTTSLDLVVPLAPHTLPLTRRNTFTRKLGFSDFLQLSEQNSDLHLAFFGSAVAGSPLDISLDTVLGASHPVTIKGLTTSDITLNLPSGIIVGISTSMYNDTAVMQADPGKRALWGIGGNLNLGTVASIVAPLISGGTATTPTAQQILALIPQLLPLVSKLQAGAAVVDQGPDAAAGSAGSATASTISLNTLLRLRTAAKVSATPALDGNFADVALVIGGAVDYPLGFVPLGFTAGGAYQEGGKNTSKILDPSCDTSGGKLACATSTLPLRMAAENGGTEGAPYGFLQVAVNIQGTGSNTSVGAISGAFQVAPVTYQAPPASNSVDFTSNGFLTLPGSSSVIFTRSSRSFSVRRDPDASIAAYRFEVENDDRLTWEVWMGPVGSTAATVTLPDPHAVDATLVDPALDLPAVGTAPRPATSRIFSIKFNDSTSYATLSGFGSVGVDELGAHLAAFNYVPVPLQ